MMAYRQSVKDTHQLILKQVTGLTMIQATKAVDMVATMNIKQPITTTTAIIIISNKEVITMVTQIVAIIDTLTILLNPTLSLGT